MKHKSDPFGDFHCIHCRTLISANKLLSGVNNRNHCPYCLWSRHVDLYQAGDRLSACKGAAQPIGLTFKRMNKRYGSLYGELMIIHVCTECGHLAINRIAADDIPATLLETFAHTLRLNSSLRERLQLAGITPVSTADEPAVRARLFGQPAGVSMGRLLTE